MDLLHQKIIHTHLSRYKLSSLSLYYLILPTFYPLYRHTVFAIPNPFGPFLWTIKCFVILQIKLKFFPFISCIPGQLMTHYLPASSFLHIHEESMLHLTWEDKGIFQMWQSPSKIRL